MTGRVLKERYRIIEKIGSGGMADVYKGHDERLDRIVALKVLKSDLSKDSEFRSRFHREAVSAAKLSHPNIISVFDIEEDEGIQFIVMEYLESNSLKAFINSQKKGIQESTLLNILRPILSALTFAHQQGIIHRDLKPHNILIGKDGTVKVTDFGIAKALFSDTLTQTGSLIGSVHYFSPEQAQGKSAAAPADLYSLGVLIFECLTGRLPFDGDNLVAIALKHVQEIPPSPSSINPSITPDMEKIIMKALLKDPLKRYQSAEEMLFDLEKAGKPRTQKIGSPSTDEPTLIVPPSKAQSPSRTQKEIEEVSLHLKKRREDQEDDRDDGIQKETSLLKAIAMGALVIVVLTGVVAGLIWGSRFLQEIETPDLVGKSYSEGQAVLQEKGLSLVIEREMFSNDKPEGTILDQNPKAGEKIRPGEKVKVIISKGNKTLEVPDVKGKTIDNARKTLTYCGFTNIKIEQVFNDARPVGIVLSQEPAPENMVSPSSMIFLRVSKGPEKQRIPDLTGKSEAEAQKLLSRMGLRLIVDATEPSAQIPAGNIIRQKPAAGTEVIKDSVIKVVVSKAMEGLTSPSLIGKTVQEAQTILEPLGVSLNIEGDEKGPDAVILSQTPRPGEVIADKVVTVTVEAQPMIPELIGKKLADARETVAARGYQIGTITYREVNDSPPDVVLEQDPAASLEATPGEKINIVVSRSGIVPQNIPHVPLTPELSPEPSPQISPQPQPVPTGK
ncbi:MAG: Stk1 family PASTA domain-containing Ser/Thr kinase [Candidatus Xenobiia bacterium LiM19]